MAPAEKDSLESRLAPELGPLWKGITSTFVGDPSGLPITDLVRRKKITPEELAELLNSAGKPELYEPIITAAGLPVLPEAKPPRKSKAKAPGKPPAADPLPDFLLPQIEARSTLKALLAELPPLLQDDLFRRGGDLVTVDAKTGEVAVMTPVRFCSWIEAKVTFVKFVGERVVAVSIAVELSAKLMAALPSCSALFELRAVHTVRTAAWSNAECTALRLLEAGFDVETGIYTVVTLEFDTEMDPVKAKEVFLQIFRHFTFAGTGPLAERGSFAAFMVLMFAANYRALFRGVLCPMFAFMANQPGAGKSLLAKAALSLVYGSVSAGSLPKDSSEMSKEITSLLLALWEYVIWDNVKGRLDSPELEALLTSLIWIGRLLGQSRMVQAANNLIVILTGNSLSLSADLARRTVMIDLFCARDATGRQFERPLSEAVFASPEMRRLLNAALWSLAKYWSSCGCPRATRKPLASFEQFCSIGGGWLETCEFGNAFEGSGAVVDETTFAWKQLLANLADIVPTGEKRAFTLDDVMETARTLETLELLVAGAKDDRKALGNRIRPFRGRELQDSRGRWFTFGNRRQSSGITYVVEVLAIPAENQSAA